MLECHLSKLEPDHVIRGVKYRERRCLDDLNLDSSKLLDILPIFIIIIIILLLLLLLVQYHRHGRFLLLMTFRQVRFVFFRSRHYFFQPVVFMIT